MARRGYCYNEMPDLRDAVGRRTSTMKGKATVKEANVVYERDEAFNMTSGPYGFERVGFSIGHRVFWTGLSASHTANRTWDEDKELAEKIVKAWNEINKRESI